MSRRIKEPFARMVLSAPRHPKLLRVRPEDRWLWWAATCYCREKETDGALPRGAIATLGIDNPWRSVARLVAAHLFDEDGADYRVHDYGDWQETKAEVEQRRQEGRGRVADWRAKHAGNG